MLFGECKAEGGRRWTHNVVLVLMVVYEAGRQQQDEVFDRDD